MQRQAPNDYSVTLGSQVSWYPKAERWRIEVTDPQTMKAVWIAPRRASSHYRSGHARSGVGFRFGSNPPSREQHIRQAEMENWKDSLGVLPQGSDGYYHR